MEVHDNHAKEREAPQNVERRNASGRVGKDSRIDAWPGSRWHTEE
jgi:hypothetical protein